MIEFWQAVVLYVLASVGACAVAYLQHRWTARAASDAEERAARATHDAEEHAARRELRSERVKPILDFLAAAQSYSAQSRINEMKKKVRDEYWPVIRDDLAKKSGISAGEADKLFHDEYEKWPTGGNFTRGLGGFFQLSQVQFLATQVASGVEIRSALTLVFSEAMNPGASPGALSQATSLLDDYIVKGE